MASSSGNEEYYRVQRKYMVERQIAARDVRDEAVLGAMAKVPRHEFVPIELRHDAYTDGPLPIGSGQTISQPYIVASMTAMLEPSEAKTVFEVGTGSGYQTAILAEVFGRVITAEYYPELAKSARALLSRLGYENIEFYSGDALALPKAGQKFDAIISTAAPEHFPDELAEHLAIGGRMVVPVGRNLQYLHLAVREGDGTIRVDKLYGVRFVPLLAQSRRR